MAQKKISANVGQFNDYETGCAVDVVSQGSGTINVLCDVDGGVVYLELSALMASRLACSLDREARKSVSDLASSLCMDGGAGE